MDSLCADCIQTQKWLEEEEQEKTLWEESFLQSKKKTQLNLNKLIQTNKNGGSFPLSCSGTISPDEQPAQSSLHSDLDQTSYILTAYGKNPTTIPPCPLNMCKFKFFTEHCKANIIISTSFESNWSWTENQFIKQHSIKINPEY